MFYMVYPLLESDVSHCQKRKSLNEIILDYELFGIYSASKW